MDKNGTSAAVGATASATGDRLPLAGRMPQCRCEWPRGAIAAGWWIVAAGTAVRLRSYLFDRSLWLDEAMLGLNLVHRDFAGLLRPLDNNQGAPILFLWAEKLMVALFGPGEFALRVVPVLAGIATLLFSFLLARRILGPRAGLIFVAMIAVSKPLLYYSTDLKQYECDAAVALAIVLAAVRAMQSGRLIDIAIWGAAGITGIWLSHPAPFVIAASTAAIFANALSRPVPRSDKVKILSLASAIAVIAAGCFLVSYVRFDRLLGQNNYLRTFWSDAFMPLNSPWRALLWFPRIMQSACEIPFGKTGWIPTSAAMAIGMILILRADRAMAVLIGGPAALALAAAVAQRYPFADRLLCFTLPMMALAAAVGIDWTWSRLSGGRVAIVGNKGGTGFASSSEILAEDSGRVLVPALRADDSSIGFAAEPSPQPSPWVQGEGERGRHGTNLCMRGEGERGVKAEEGRSRGRANPSVQGREERRRGGTNDPARYRPRRRALFAVAALAWMVGEPAGQAVMELVVPRGYQEIKPVMQFIALHRQPGDRIFAMNEARMAFEFYAPRYGLDGPEYEPHSAEGNDLEVRRDVEQLRGHGRIWIVFAAPGLKRFAKEARLMGALHDNAVQLDEFDAEGARTVLYQMKLAG